MNLIELYKQLSNKYGNKNKEMVFTFSDKGSVHSYIEFYERYFEAKQDCVALLEIGMMTGGSMHLWQKYFTKYSLVGLDLSPTWNQPRPFQTEIEQDPDITLIFNCNSCVGVPTEIQNKKFDFVIDDGDHAWCSQIDTFINYWTLVQEQGIYFIEDIIGPEEIIKLTNRINEHCALLGDSIAVDHHRGSNTDRADDQILYIRKIKDGNNK